MKKIIQYAAVISALFLPITSFSAALTNSQFQALKSLPPAQLEAILRAANIDSGKVTTPQVATPDIPPVVVPRSVAPEMIGEISSTGEDESAMVTLESTAQMPKPELKPFGYDLFAGAPTTFAPVTEIPIPSEYVIGPGDSIKVQLFGKESAEYDLLVSRTGEIHFPAIGPISVIGLPFHELKQTLNRTIKKQLIGVSASISIGQLRSIRIFVLGNAYRPGSYTVSSLSTITNALFVSGGIQEIGSLRNIQLKRNGKLVSSFDLYDLLLHGDTSADQRLQPGDVIFIPPIGSTVGIDGEIQRPAIYEIKDEKRVKDVIAFSGGTLPTAYLQQAHIERISSRGIRTVFDLDLLKSSGAGKRIFNGDIIYIPRVLDDFNNIVTLTGHFQRPRNIQWRKGLRVANITQNIGAVLKPNPDLEYALIRREKPHTRSTEILSFDILEAISDRTSKHNIELHPNDELIAFGISERRSEAIGELIEELKIQEAYNDRAKVVTVEGNVRFPSSYPWVNGMRISDLINASYDILPGTDLDYALLERRNGLRDEIYVEPVKLKAILEDPMGLENLLLKPEDRLYLFSGRNLKEDKSEQLREITDIDEIDYAGRYALRSLLKRLKDQASLNAPAQIVKILGHISYPGEYPLAKGMTVRDLIYASGLLSQKAYQYEGEIIRYEESENRERVTHREKVNFTMALNGNFSHNLHLQPFDTLIVKKLPHWDEQRIVTISGEVLFPGEYVIKAGETLHSLVQRAGGISPRGFVDGAVFMREELRKKEEKQLSTLHTRLRAEIASFTVGQASIGENANVVSAKDLELLLEQIESAKPMGRLVINLSNVLADTSDIKLRNGDHLIVPVIPQEVSVIGEVNYPTSHLSDTGLDVMDYIQRSGGISKLGDAGNIYVVQSNGGVISNPRGGFFRSAYQPKIGDTIVVPQDLERVRPLTFWTSITQIFYQLGVAAAAWHTVGVF